MRTRRVRFLGLLSVPLILFLLAPWRAAADNDDPPGRVARLSVIEGSVSFEPAGTNDWVSAVVNRPMTTGDKLWTDRGSRAELHLGAVSIRLSSQTAFSFLNLSDNATQIRLTEGTVRVRVKQLQSQEAFEVDTPNLAFSILRPGIYRFNVNDAGDVTAITVHDGEGEVTGGGQYFTVRASETAIFSGTDQLSPDFREMYGDDDFDRWCMNRDRREDRSVSLRYVSPEVVGYEDLDDYGYWSPVPEYGEVWFPHATIVGWAPYRYGHWVYIWPWGYTWIEDEPWGFAPFHYGRWICVRGSWGWVPCPPPVVGVAYVRPVYAPALVAWVGGSHWSVSVGVGGGPSVGWFPLGPHEVYVPSYPVSRRYVQNVNITNTAVNTTVINNYYNTTIVRQNNVVVHNNIRYVNRDVQGAVTVTSQQTIVAAQSVASHMVRVKENELQSTQVVATTPHLTPEKQAFLGGGQRASVAPPQEVMTRKVVARTAPPSPPPSFEEQHAALQQNGGRPVPVSQMRRVEDGQPAGVRMAPGMRPAPVVSGGNQPANIGTRPAPSGDSGQRANNPLPRNIPSRSYVDRPPEARPPIQESRPPEVAQPRGAERPRSDQPRLDSERPQSSPQPQVDRSRAPQDQGRPRYDQPQNNSDRRRAYDEQQPQVDRPRPPQDDQPRYEQPRQPERPPEPRQAQPQERPTPPPQRERPIERTQPQPQERPAPPPQRERPIERTQPQPQERPAPRSEPARPAERPQPQGRSEQQAR